MVGACKDYIWLCNLLRVGTKPFSLISGRLPVWLVVALWADGQPPYEMLLKNTVEQTRRNVHLDTSRRFDYVEIAQNIVSIWR